MIHNTISFKFPPSN